MERLCRKEKHVGIERFLDLTYDLNIINENAFKTLLLDIPKINNISRFGGYLKILIQ